MAYRYRIEDLDAFRGILLGVGLGAAIWLAILWGVWLAWGG
jgi:hypothetical protein